MKNKRYLFLSNDNKEVVDFCGLIKRKHWFRRKGTIPFRFYHHHLVKEVWVPAKATAVHAGVFAELTALEDFYLDSGNVTLFEGSLPDHKVTIHLPLDASCRSILQAYDWHADNTVGTGFASILWHVQKGKARLHLTLEEDCCELPEFFTHLPPDIIIESKAGD